MKTPLPTPERYMHLRGERGCCQWVRVNGKQRFCSTKAIAYVNGKGYCFRHIDAIESMLDVAEVITGERHETEGDTQAQQA